MKKIARIVTVPFTFISLMDFLDTISSDIDTYEVHVITSRGEFLSIMEQKLPNVVFHEVTIPRDIKLWSDVKALIKLVEIFLDEKFDIVHSHTPKAGLLVAIAGKITGQQVVLHTFTGQVWVHYQGLKRELFKFIDKMICRLCTKTYTDSHSQKEFLIKNGIGSNEKLIVLNKGSFAGVDLQKFSRANNYSLSRDVRSRIFPSFEGVLILYLGRLNNDKGLLELGDAFFSLKKKYDIRLLIVGPRDVLNCENADMIRLLEQSKDVYFENFTTNPEVYLSLADIYCLPSYREGCPTTVIEASACEVPVVASDIYGIQDVVVDQVTGFLFKCRNSQDLATKLELLISSQSLRNSMGKKGRDFAVENFNQKDLTHLLIEDYNAMIGIKSRNDCF